MTTPRLLYTLFMVLAIAVFLAARQLTPRSPAVAALPRWQRAALVLAAFVGGALGAKLPFALAEGLFEGSAWLADGKTIVTGLAGAYLAVELTKLTLDIRVKTGDSFAVPIALALAVGRWGCFFNGCCHGTPTGLPWAVDFGDGVSRHPVQLYESLAMLVFLGAFLWALRARSPLVLRHGFYLFVAWYGAQRFVWEFLKPYPRLLGPLNLFHVACLALLLYAAFMMRLNHELIARG